MCLPCQQPNEIENSQKPRGCQSTLLRVRFSWSCQTFLPESGCLDAQNGYGFDSTGPGGSLSWCWLQAPISEFFCEHLEAQIVTNGKQMLRPRACFCACGPLPGGCWGFNGAQSFAWKSAAMQAQPPHPFIGAQRPNVNSFCRARDKQMQYCSALLKGSCAPVCAE